MGETRKTPPLLSPGESNGTDGVIRASIWEPEMPTWVLSDLTSLNFSLFCLFVTVKGDPRPPFWGCENNTCKLAEIIWHVLSAGRWYLSVLDLISLHSHFRRNRYLGAALLTSFS